MAHSSNLSLKEKNMNVWELRGAIVPNGKSEFAMLRTTSLEDCRMLMDEFKGQPWLPRRWKSLQLVRDPRNQDEAQSQELGDMARIDSYGSIANFSQKAQSVLLPHIAPYGEVLPVHFDEAAFAIFNVTHIIDALDEQASEIKYFKSSGKVMTIERFVFKPEVIKDQWIFKLPQDASNFVTDRFVEVVRAAGLRGFEFIKLWSGEAA
jgi:hypothetical protein